ncbi:L-aspartate oxidase [Paenibacillus sp. P96]|uniref:L-aspartate oxidase n=1 Tax=Paenibacillus zeirhizosphaerae TaxID=2987519 RepID=A0ABT9FR92_9BACL|nr:L-aspartate oxidase [Paenibacillus sp. P96]MDP4097240.1 L-aspartate oxidase [Paenibacillus sp. P96]
MSFRSVIVIGSGAAALSFATAMPKDTEITLLTKSTVTRSNSMLAQGGIASFHQAGDTAAAHLADTLAVGGGHNDVKVAAGIIEDGRHMLERLLEQRFPFDLDEQGEPQLGREGGHHVNRIFHAGGDATGKMLVRHLVERLGDNVRVMEQVTVYELLMEQGSCTGVLASHEETGLFEMRADAVVIAAGGCGSLFSRHTNDTTVTGDGLMMAYRAGAELTDLEFIQFHPTLLVHEGICYGLVSEAVRGEGGVIRDETGRRIMNGRHAMADLAPRDVVARVMHEEIRNGHSLYIDISGCRDFADRFPTISSLCEAAGIDIRESRIPVAPGMHFLMGGIRVNEWGESTVPGLYAIGEAACTGLHGANRLASNSLLEALVMGDRVAQRITQLVPGQFARESGRSLPAKEREGSYELPRMALEELQQRMSDNMSIQRSGEELRALYRWLHEVKLDPVHVQKITKEQLERLHLWQLAKLVTASALQREESRGAHFRVDFSVTDDDNWRGKQIIHSRNGIQIRENEGIAQSWNVYS